MKLANFSAQEQACHAKCMVLHCLWKKAKGDKNNYGMPLTATRVMATVTVTTWAMAMVTRVADDKEGEGTTTK